MNRNPQDLRPSGSAKPSSGGGSDQPWRWLIVLALVIALVLILTHAFARTDVKQLGYSQFVSEVTSKQVTSATYNNESGIITGTLKNGTTYATTA
ncbi:MAG: ATP-dependent metallopeptidase FtsH/Yme1/Tma family protein, partial [Acidimicrobiales bacterium]